MKLCVCEQQFRRASFSQALLTLECSKKISKNEIPLTLDLMFSFLILVLKLKKHWWQSTLALVFKYSARWRKPEPGDIER